MEAGNGTQPSTAAEREREAERRMGEFRKRHQNHARVLESSRIDAEAKRQLARERRDERGATGPSPSPPPCSNPALK